MIDNIVIDLDYEWVVEPIRVRIELNDLVLYEGTLDKRRIECNVQLINENCLRIHLLNKPRGSTKVDQFGTIIKDTYIEVSSIMVNKRKFRFAINDCGKVITKHSNNTLPKSSKICYEGYYEINFSSPVGQFLRNYYAPFSYNSDVESSISSLTETIESLKHEAVGNY